MKAAWREFLRVGRLLWPNPFTWHGFLRRSEYMGAFVWAILAHFLFVFVGAALLMAHQVRLFMDLNLLEVVLFVLSWLAWTIRRLRDARLSQKWWFILLLPLLGPLFLTGLAMVWPSRVRQS